MDEENLPGRIDRLLTEALINQTISGGSSVADIARACAAAMSNCAGVPIGDVDLTGVSTVSFLRGLPLYGRAADVLRDHGLAHSVKEGHLYICKKAPAPPVSLENLLGQLAIVIKGSPATAEKKQRRRGPTPGQVDHFSKADSELFSELEQLWKSKGSQTAAAKVLAEQGKIAGGGTMVSKAKRLVKRYRETH